MTASSRLETSARQTSPRTRRQRVRRYLMGAFAAGVVLVGLLVFAVLRVAHEQADGVTPADALVFIKSFGDRSSEPTDRIVADLEEFVPRYLREQGIRGAAIALTRGSDIVWSKGFGWADSERTRPLTPDTPYFAGSLLKTVLVIGALRLAQERGLDIDRDVEAYLDRPTFVNPYRSTNAVTLRALMDHSAGFPHMLSQGGGLGPDGGDGLLARFSPSQLRITYPPGRFSSRISMLTGWRTSGYSGLGMLALAGVVERISGRRLADFYQTEVLEPLGMQHSTFTPDPAVLDRLPDGEMEFAWLWRSGTPVPTSSLALHVERMPIPFVTTVDDMSRLAAVIANRGTTSDGGAFLAPEWIDRILTPSSRASLMVRFGLGVVVDPDGDGAAFGGLSNIASGFFCTPSGRYCAVVMTTHRHLADVFAILSRAIEG